MMTWNLALWALLFVSSLAVISSLITSFTERPRTKGSLLQTYFLANFGLERHNVIHLLLSGSFSLNGMLYQIWLGYIIGIWALLIQVFWALSYVWLATYVPRIREAQSLHSFLGVCFGNTTRMLASICSIIGFTILIGWEFNVGKSTFEGIFARDSATVSPDTRALWFTVATVLVSFIYTASGGLRGNAWANRIQNFLKAGVFCILIGLLLVVFSNSLPTFLWDAFLWDALKLSPTKIIETIGVAGLITNIAFSLVWQFVDMSTWQNVIASRNQSIEESQKTLQWSGGAVFCAPGIIGTAMGVLLANQPGIESNNVMTHVLQTLPDNPLLVFFVLVALIAAIMSLIDGLLLATGYSVTHDIVYRAETLEQLDGDETHAAGILGRVRLFLAVLAITGTAGVYWVLEAFGISLFDIVYLLIICQLALIGPVWIGLQRTPVGHEPMWYAIAAALVGGIGSVIWSQFGNVKWLMDAAGLITIVFSLAVAWGIQRKYRAA